ncbi:rhodanese-like domain-containing protein [Campylobacter sp. MG1]|uniref:rhodanese-like domain-containing protein n=1 Tax=Campylobacter sp. MG1 TaxID=2976332 RepID=UPI00226CABE6|nr:rhodanese-like domain-containing protein [Campylobacter sp. MG1]
MKKLLMFLGLFGFLNADVTNVKISEFDFSNNENLIDVRMPKEYAETGVVNGAKLITYLNEDGSINPEFLNEVNKNFAKDSKIAIMCKSGKRSAMVTKMLEQNGFTNIINLDGGMNELLKTDIKLVPYQN